MRSNEEALELLFLQPQQAIDWLKLEMFVGLVWSFSLAVPSIVYVLVNWTNCWEGDSLLVCWLVATSLCKVVDIPLKAYILRRLDEIEDLLDFEDWRFATRRLMQLTQSALYKSFSLLVNLSAILHPLGVLRMWRAGHCAAESTQFYRLCVLVIVNYILRCSFGFFNYSKALKQAERQRNWERKDFLIRGATLEQIGKLRVEGIQMKGQTCAVCTEDFELGDKVRELPCGHYYHIPCIDLWLVQNRKCPLCSNELR
jgi:hypothetical protein